MAGPEKSDGAFRTIREVADWLGVPTHVLRFWESKFDQIAPVKGAGGRRYYRPEDMRLLGGIKVMLHDQGLPIRGVSQRIDEDGAESVMSLSPDLDTPDTAAAPKPRRVIRPREDAAVPASPGTAGKGGPPPERISPPAPPTVLKPAVEAERTPSFPEPDEADPSQPGDELSVGQLGDETDDVPQPSDEPVKEPLDGSGQPDVPSTGRDLSKAPATDPETDPGPEVVPHAPPMPDHESNLETDTGPQRYPVAPDRSEADPLGTGSVDAGSLDAGSVDAGTSAHVTSTPASPASGAAAPDRADPDLSGSGPTAPEDPIAGSDRSIHVLPSNQRRLRRIIRKLRGLIEEVEGELAEDAGTSRSD